MDQFITCRYRRPLGGSLESDTSLGWLHAFFIIIEKMKFYNQALLLLTLFTLLHYSSIRADDFIRLNVGDKTTVTLPYSPYRSTDGYGTWSCDVNGILKYVGSKRDVDIEVLKYTSSTCHVKYSYSYRENGYSRTSFYTLSIDINKPSVSVVADPSGGKVEKGDIVYLSCPEHNDAKIYYTLNGTTPSSSWTGYSNWTQVRIEESCTLKAIASWGGVDSEVLTEKYTVDEDIVDELTLSASPKGGVVDAGTFVTLTSSEYGADIYYTTDGTTPGKGDIKYTSKIKIDKDCTIKAIAYKDGKSSSILEERYTIKIIPTDIYVYLSDNSVLVNGNIYAHYSLTPSNASSNVKWYSDDPTIAKIDISTGKITGVKVGSTYIRGKTENGLESSCKVNVVVLGVKSAVAGYSHTIFTKEDGSLWGMGRTVYDYGLISNDKVPTKMHSTTGNSPVISITAGDGNLRFVTTAGDLWGCGSNSFGQLGDKHNSNSSYHFIMSDVASVSGQLCSHIIKTDGSLWACGLNREGNLGNGTTKNQTTPVFIMDNVSYVSSGGNHTLIIKKDKSLWACGWNYYGQLGDGTTTSRTTPVKIMDDVVFASAGGGHSLIIKTDGSLWACGSNSDGQLCDGTTTNRLTPKKIMDGVTFVEASNCSFIVKKDGSLWGCGSNSNGELGIGSRKSQSTLVKIMDNVSSVSSSGNYTVFVKNNGSLWACGENDYGQLGDGTTIDRSTPIEVVQGMPEMQKIKLTVSPSGGDVSSGSKVYLTASANGSDVSGVSIYYTLNGNMPTTSNNKYTSSGITINESCTLKAFASKSGYTDSDVMTWSYTVSDYDIEINATNFPDKAFRDKLLSQDYGKDGRLTGTEISKIKSISVSGSYSNKGSITSLIGIEHFTALEELYCHNNQLTALDISKNTALTYLDCDHNQLTALDVSKNTALTSLYCSYNQLTALDVSKNTALTDLSCYNNQLTALDVSKNTALTSLDCDYNQLTALDVSKNTALTSLYCSGIQLTALDVSKNMALTRLNCNNNQLTALDVSKNTALTSLSCHNNQLTALDVSKNTALEELYCYYNQLTALDVSKNTALTRLDCYNNKLRGKAMDDLINSLPMNSSDKQYEIRLFSSTSPNEGNVCTKAQVESAKAKGWTPMYYYNYSWQEYEGYDDSAKSISLPVTETVNIGSTITLTPTITPEDANTTLKWESDDTSIAKVSQSGVVLGLKEGTAIISVTTSNDLKAECFVTVTDPTGITEIKAGDDADSEIFDLFGRKLDKPRKGINIINGKKVVVK